MKKALVLALALAILGGCGKLFQSAVKEAEKAPAGANTTNPNSSPSASPNPSN